jgi:hypothetical protein
MTMPDDAPSPRQGKTHAMSRKPSDASGVPRVSTVRRDSPFPTAAIVLVVAVIALMGLALLSPLRDRLIAPPPPTRMPDLQAPSPALPAPSPTAPQQALPAPPPAPKVVETPLTLMPAAPPPAVPPPAPAAPAPSGDAGLIEGLRVGQLGMASGGDLSRWTLRWSEANGRGVPQEFLDVARRTKTYVIRKDFTLPDGLHGAHAVIFILDRHVPHPRGNPGHSAILDMTSGACAGALCYGLTED